MSISEKLANYQETRELLNRLKIKELMKLAQKNKILLKKENGQRNLRKVRTKAEIIDVLVASNFKESDLIELLGVSRLDKKELLKKMTLLQLRELAKETGITLKKSTFFGTKQARRKEDIINILIVLPKSKIIQHSNKMRIIARSTKKKVKKLLIKKHSEKSEKPLETDLQKALKSVQFIGEGTERKYESQLSKWLSCKGYTVRRGRARKLGKLDLEIAESETAIELKKIKSSRSFNRLIGRVYRYQDMYRKILVLIIDHLHDSKMMRKQAEKIQKINPRKIEVIIKT